MSEENTEINNEKDEVVNLYEAGFHLVPTLTEEEAKEEFEAIVELVKKQNATVKGSFVPEMRDLAYEMGKSTSGKKQGFSNAYFGQIIFEAEPKSILSIKKSVESLPKVIRTLFIEVPVEALLPRERRVTQSNREESVKQDESAKEEVVPISEAELDKTIEALVIE